MYQSIEVRALTVDTDASVLYWCVYDQERENITVYYSDMTTVYHSNSSNDYTVEILTSWTPTDDNM